MSRRNTVSPWALTLQEARCMDLYLELGSGKLAAAAAGLHLKTVQFHIWAAHRRIRSALPQGRNRSLHCTLAWYEWRKEVAAS